MRQNARATVAIAGLLSLAAAPAAAEEGMWTFDNFPSESMREELGWAPDQAWLDRVMAGTARMPGCSASNVSDAGLVLTNHHCVIACVTSLSSAEANFIADGFMARLPAEELRCPNMSVQVLTEVVDVTARIQAATATVAPEAFAMARDAEIARLQRECTAGMQRCEVVTLYEGGRYALHTYKRFEDVRIVFAPEHSMAAFGGDTDNFNFPRYCIDFAFLRLYENGRPAETPNHLDMRFTPLEEEEIVLIAGNPGRTSRLHTTAELAFERDVDLPWQIAALGEARARLNAFASLGPDQARIASSALQEVQNSFKGLQGRRDALANAEGFARVVAREEDLQTRVRRNQAATREVGDAWGEIARAQAVYRTIFHQYQNLEQRAGERSQLFYWARDIVRAAEDRERPDAERLPRYRNAWLGSIAQFVRQQRPVTPAVEEVYLAVWLSQLRAQLGANDPLVQRMFGGQTPEALAAQLARSRVADPAYRIGLWDGGAAAVAASDDPLIQFVRAWDGEARAVRARYIAEVEAPVARAHERIARARFRAFGDARYPDATFSPRVSYGRVEGWTEPGGRTAPAFTRVSGLYERATAEPPFALSQRWIDARDRLDPNAIFNVATSTDVISGSSGSPLLDREGRVVGAVFDGNIHSLGGEYYYDGALNRSVTVASTAIRAALADVYGMDALLAELGGQ